MKMNLYPFDVLRNAVDVFLHTFLITITIIYRFLSSFLFYDNFYNRSISFLENRNKRRMGKSAKNMEKKMAPMKLSKISMIHSCV